jgi:serine/threonine protein kinase
LKLENVLVTLDGHIKLADYGICKDNVSFGDTTRTYCGTPDYMAPEILRHQQYTRAVDWWSFGVLMYAMLIGQFPFGGDDEKAILDSILSNSVSYPKSLPAETLKLMQGVSFYPFLIILIKIH